MTNYLVRLAVKSTGAPGEETWSTSILEPANAIDTPRAADDFLLDRRYRSYLADPRWLPAPTRVSLTGKNATHTRRALTYANGYELELVGPAQTGLSNWKKGMERRLVTLAAAAAVVLPFGQTAGAQSASNTPRPPSMSRGDSAVEAGGPPTNTLCQEKRPMAQLTDEHGKPLRVASFHQNSPPGHSNTPPSHTNVWSNHSNNSAHLNVWNNHANVPQYFIPHTNITPGDWIF